MIKVVSWQAASDADASWEQIPNIGKSVVKEIFLVSFQLWGDAIERAKQMRIFRLRIED